MLILGFDTATPWGTIALVEDDQPIFEISLKAGKGSGEYLLALLDTLLKKTRRKIADLDLISVGTGPGSYTGIRVGLAAAQGLAAARQIKVYGPSTLRIIAENARFAAEWIAPVMDARHGYVYSALYRNCDGNLMIHEAPARLLAEELTNRLADLPNVMLCGDGGKCYTDIWNSHSNLQIAPAEWDRPSGTVAARIGAKKLSLQPEAQLNFDFSDLTPCYLRKVEAEVHLEESLNATQNRIDENRGS
jgi:tRNA threonylcarbamoyladenosine biosynthesis protein TsaB